MSVGPAPIHDQASESTLACRGISPNNWCAVKSPVSTCIEIATIGGARPEITGDGDVEQGVAEGLLGVASGMNTNARVLVSSSEQFIEHSVGVMVYSLPVANDLDEEVFAGSACAWMAVVTPLESRDKTAILASPALGQGPASSTWWATRGRGQRLLMG